MSNVFNIVFCKERCLLDSCEKIEDASVLDLSDCELKDIPSNIANTTHLKVLNLEDNNIERIEHFDNLGELEYLNLGINQLSEISGLDGLKRLKTLRLHDNNLRKIENLNSLIFLEKLDLRSNHIQWIEGLRNQSKLNEIDLGDNPLQSTKERRMFDRGFEFEKVGIDLKKKEIAQNLVELSRKKEKSVLSRWAERIKRKIIVGLNGK